MGSTQTEALPPGGRAPYSLTQQTSCEYLLHARPYTAPGDTTETQSDQRNKHTITQISMKPATTGKGQEGKQVGKIPHWGLGQRSNLRENFLEEVISKMSET